MRIGCPGSKVKKSVLREGNDQLCQGADSSCSIKYLELMFVLCIAAAISEHAVEGEGQKSYWA